MAAAPVFPARFYERSGRVGELQLHNVAGDLPPAGFNGGRTDHASLQRQAPNNYNIGVIYDKSRLALRFAVSHNDENIASYFWTQPGGVDPKDPVLGLKGPNGDQYFYPHTQVGIQGSYRFYKGFTFVAYGLNLTIEVFGFYQYVKMIALSAAPWGISEARSI